MATIFDNPDVVTIILKLKKSKCFKSHNIPQEYSYYQHFLTEIFYFRDLSIAIIRHPVPRCETLIIFVCPRMTSIDWGLILTRDKKNNHIFDQQN